MQVPTHHHQQPPPFLPQADPTLNPTPLTRPNPTPHPNRNQPATPPCTPHPPPTLTSPQPARPTPTQVTRRFDVVDTGKDGSIDMEGAKALIKKLHLGVDNEELDLAIQALENRKNRIDHRRRASCAVPSTSQT